MTDASGLTILLDALRKEPAETEWLEFKVNRYDPQVLGEYLKTIKNNKIRAAYLNRAFIIKRLAFC